MKKKSVAPSYAEDGVNLVEGDTFSKFCGGVCRSTYEYSHLIKVNDMSEGHFRGPRTFRIRTGISKYCQLSGDCDGNGTRVIMDAIANTPESAATTLIAMTGMDGVRYGGRNGLLLNQLDTSSLGKNGDSVNKFFRSAIASLGNLAKQQGLVLLKGETAEMGPCVGSQSLDISVRFTWCGTMISVFHPDVMITGTELAPGQTLIALREYGLRGNGGSSARKAFAKRYGPEWYKVPAAQQDIQQVAAPCVLYENFLQFLNGWNDLSSTGAPQPHIRISAIAHITGGGIPSKLFGDILKPAGFSCVLDNLWAPPPIMTKLVEWRGISGKEPYDTYHCGGGVIAVVDKADVQRFCEIANTFGHEAKPVGEIFKKKGKPTLSIRSQFDSRTYTW